MSHKQKLRAIIQKKRKNLSARERQKKSRAAAERFFRCPHYKNASAILAYYPFRSEIDTTMVIQKALSDHKKIMLPKVHQNKLQLFYTLDLKTQLQKGTYGIMEPVQKKCVPAKIEDIDLVLVPGVAFDRNLNRLGYGGGFYDRLLARLSPEVKKIVLCFHIQLVPQVPTLDHDIKVDMIITESEEIA